MVVKDAEHYHLGGENVSVCGGGGGEEKEKYQSVSA